MPDSLWRSDVRWNTGAKFEVSKFQRICFAFWIWCRWSFGWATSADWARANANCPCGGMAKVIVMASLVPASSPSLAAVECTLATVRATVLNGLGWLWTVPRRRPRASVRRLPEADHHRQHEKVRIVLGFSTRRREGIKFLRFLSLLRNLQLFV